MKLRSPGFFFPSRDQEVNQWLQPGWVLLFSEAVYLSVVKTAIFHQPGSQDSCLPWPPYLWSLFPTPDTSVSSCLGGIAPGERWLVPSQVLLVLLVSVAPRSACLFSQLSTHGPPHPSLGCAGFCGHCPVVTQDPPPERE